MEIAFILLFISLWLVILFNFNKTLGNLEYSTKQRLKKTGLIIGVLLIWIILQSTISSSGFYDDTNLPPRIVIFQILPLFLFTFIFLISNKKHKILNAIPVYLPIAYQSFRVIIELYFHQLYKQGILPQQVTYSGYNFDIVFGASAIFMALYAYRKTPSKRVLLIWNLLGITVVLNAAFTFITSFYFPQIWGSNEPELAEIFLRFPYQLLPSFFMPSAVFFHVLSIVQLKQIR